MHCIKAKHPNCIHVAITSKLSLYNEMDGILIGIRDWVKSHSLR